MDDAEYAGLTPPSAHLPVKLPGERKNPSEAFCCLSPVVKKLILVKSDQKQPVSLDSYEYFSKDRRLSWKSLTKSSLLENTQFPDSSEVWDGILEKDWFIASMNVQKVSFEAARVMNSCTIDELRVLYKSAFFGPTIVRIHQAFLETQNALIGFAALCPLLERTLGDIFASWEDSMQPNPKLRRKPPPLIRDLLQTEELKILFGEDTIFLMQVLIGSPRSLNLRNIIWHGFAAPHEIHAGFYWILLVLFLDLSDRDLLPRYDTDVSLSISSPLQSTPNSTIVLKTRELKDLTIIPPSSYDFGLGSMSILSAYRNNAEGSLSEDQIVLKNEIYEILQKSTFVLPERGQLVTLALDHFANGELDPFGYYLCLIYLLPALEHCLRAKWIKSNHLPYPLLCADSYRYYTIIDMFMDTHLHDEVVSIEALTTVGQIQIDSTLASSSSLPIPSSSAQPSSSSISTPFSRENALIDEIGTNLMIALNDVFLYPFGPRPRDRISHGDVNPVTVTRCAAARCLEIFFAIALRYLPLEVPSWAVPKSLVPCQTYFERYVVCWHPHALLERQLHETVFSVWCRWKASILSLPLVNAENSEEDDVIRRREGYHEEMETVMALVAKISVSRGPHPFLLENWICIDTETLRETRLEGVEEVAETLKLTWFDSLNCESLATATFESLRKGLVELHSVIEAWLERFETQKSQVESKQATTRLVSTFWKQLALLNLATLFFSACLRFWESRLLREALPPKLVRKLMTGLAQFKQKVAQNAWDEIAVAIVATTTIIAELC